MRPSTHTVIATVLLCAARIVYTRHIPEFGRFFVGHNDSGSTLIVPHAYSYDATMLPLPLWSGMCLSTRWLTRVVSATLCLLVACFFMILEPPFAAAMGIAVIGFFLATALDPGRAVLTDATCHI